MIVSSVSASSGNVSVGSAIVVPRRNCDLPTGFTVPDGEEVIVAEVYHDFQPFITFGIIGPSQIHGMAFYRLRYVRLSAFAI